MGHWAEPLMKRKPKTSEHEYFQGVHSYIDEDGRRMVVAPAETHVIRSKRQLEAYKEKKQSGRKHGFTFSRMESIAEVSPKLLDAHAGFLLYLQCFIDYNGAIVGTDKIPLDRDQIKEKLGIKETAFKKFIAEMKRLEIINVEGGIYRINERFHFRGETNDLKVIRTFTAKVKELYGNVSAKDLGFVYKLLPFVHLDTNTICANPYERDLSNTQPLSKKEISDLTDVTEKSVYNKLRNLKFGDEFVFAEITTGGIYAYYRINPFIFYRKAGRPDPSLAETFLIKSKPFRGRHE